MQKQIGGAERVADLERQRRALRHPELERIEGERHRRLRRPGALAAVTRRERAKLFPETIARVSGGTAKERLHRGGKRRVSGGRRIIDECAIVRVSVSVDVARDDGRVGRPGAEVAEPVYAHRVEEVISEIVLDLVARIER